MTGSKKILITGAGGYVGSRLCDFLAKQGNQIIALYSSQISAVNNNNKLISKAIIGDITDDVTINKIYDEQANIIINLVSLDHLESEKNHLNSCKINMLPTWNLLEKYSTSGNLSKFINFSSVQVYGKNDNGNIETQPNTAPLNTYALTHLLTEEICNYYNRKLNAYCVNIRLSNSYGEPFLSDRKCWSLVVNDLVKTAFENKKIVLKSDGNIYRDFIHYTDVCYGINKLINQSQPKNKNTFNFCSSKTIKLIDLALVVKYIYKIKYGDEIPIFINEDQLFVEKDSNNYNYKSTLPNNLIGSEYISLTRKIEDGVNDLFIYLEENSL